MSKKLFRVVRSTFHPETQLLLGDGRAAGFRRSLPQVIIPSRGRMDMPDDGPPPNYQREAEFFLVSDEEVPLALQALAEGNPGCEVQVYNLEQIAQCPAAPMVIKRVTADGVLPS